MKIVKMTNQDPRFYPTMGPYLSRRSIADELGAPVWDEDDKTWWVAMRGQKVLGFVSATEEAGRIRLQSDYMLPEYRRQGVYAALFTARLDHYQGREMRAVATPQGLEVFKAHGFVADKPRGRYTIMIRQATSG